MNEETAGGSQLKAYNNVVPIPSLKVFLWIRIYNKEYNLL